MARVLRNLIIFLFSRVLVRVFLVNTVEPAGHFTKQTITTVLAHQALPVETASTVSTNIWYAQNSTKYFKLNKQIRKAYHSKHYQIVKPVHRLQIVKLSLNAKIAGRSFKTENSTRTVFVKL